MLDRKRGARYNIPGVYESKTEEGAAYQVLLKADHTGIFRFQDSGDVLGEASD